MSDQEVVTRKRDRVSKACTHCRKKKIKCDGATPCRNCSQSGSTCIYPSDAEKKARVKTNGAKVSKSQSIQQLDNRLAKLEGLILSLTSKLGSEAAPDPGSENDDPSDDSTIEADVPVNMPIRFTEPQMPPQRSQHSPFANVSSLSGNSPKISFMQDGLANNVHQVSNVRSSDRFSYDRVQALVPVAEPPLSRMDKPFPGAGGKKDSFHILEKFYGSHSIFHIFSESSIEWLREKIPPNHGELMLPISNFALLFGVCVKTFTDIWFAPKSDDPESRRRLVEGWFPDEEDLVIDLMDCFEDVFLAGYLCDASDVKALFKQYYINKTLPVKKKFKYSELLIMNISLAISISAVLDKRMYAESSPGSSNGRTATLFAYSTDDLLSLQTRFFSSSIYYYDMISVMSDGIKTVQAILLLIIYLETSWIKSSANYILSSIAVRYAQEIGLHRYETFINLPREEADFRRKIWWYCEYLDMEICYRNGKPPLINPADVSTLSSKDLLTNCDMAKMSPGGEMSPLNKVLLDKLMERGTYVYCCHFLSLLNKVRAKSYTSLFSASCSSHSLTDIVKTLKDLNKDIFVISDSIIPQLKPRFYNDPAFHESVLLRKSLAGEGSNELLLTFHLTYFIHLLTINRLISQIDTSELQNEDQEIVTFRSLAIDSARTILHLIRRLDRTSIPFSCINWVIYYPFGAFLILLAHCLNRPNSVETKDDVDLLVDVLLNFFAFNSNVMVSPSKKGYSKIFNQRESVTFIVAGVMLEVGLRIIESKSNINVIDSNLKLQKYLHDCRTIFPQLFRDNGCPQSKIDVPVTHNSSESAMTEEPTEDSPFSIPRGMHPGPTGYMRIPFETPKDFQDIFGDQTIANNNNFKNSLSELLHPSPNTLNNKPEPENGISNWQPTTRNSLLAIGGDDFTDSLDKILGSGTPNFFYDNSVGF